MELAMRTNRCEGVLSVVVLLLLVPASIPTSAAACMPGPEVWSPPKTLVKNASVIYLARAVSAKLFVANHEDVPKREETAAGLGPEKVTAESKRAPTMQELLEELRKSRSPEVYDRIDYKFSVVETLTGPSQDTLELQLQFKKHRALSQFKDFNQHRDESFWDDYGGRMNIRGDCSITTVFEVGQTYLIFPHTYHVKAYELILDDDDKWLAFVRTHRRKSSQSGK
jgi:hypothetical protein